MMRKTPLNLFLFLFLSELFPRILTLQALKSEIVYPSMILAGIGADLAYASLWTVLFLFLSFFIRKPRVILFLLILVTLVKSFAAYTNYKFALVNHVLIPLHNIFSYGEGLFTDSLFLRGIVTEAYSVDFLWVVGIPLFVCLIGRSPITSWSEARWGKKVLFLFLFLIFLGIGNSVKWSFSPIRNVAGPIQSHYIYYWSMKPVDKDILDYDFPEKWKEIAPLFVQPKQTLTPPKLDYSPNIIIFTMESFRARENSAFGAKPGITPYFDKLSKKGVLFSRVFQSGCCTPSGIWADLCAQQPQIDFISVKQTYAPVKCMSDIFHGQGYKTWWLHPMGGGSERYGAFHTFHKVEKLMDGFQYPSDGEFLGWAYSDGETMKMARKIVKESKEPFYLHIHTQTNHSPFITPDGYAIDYGVDNDHYNKFLNSMRYSDEMMGKFVEEMLETEIGKRTIFVITADHGNWFKDIREVDRPGWTNEIIGAHIPFLIIFPEEYKMANKRIDTLGNQTDILPTVLDAMGQRYPETTFGYSLFQKREAERYVYMTQNDKHWFFTDDFFIQVHPEIQTPEDWNGNALEKEPATLSKWMDLIPIMKQYNLWLISKKNEEEKQKDMKAANFP